MFTNQSSLVGSVNSSTDVMATPVFTTISDDRKHRICAAVATWSFGALAIEECVPFLLNGHSAVDAVEKGINMV